MTTPAQGRSSSSEPMSSLPATPQCSHWCQPAVEGSLSLASWDTARSGEEACFSSELTATVDAVSSSLLKGCSVAGVVWWKALGFWGATGMFLWNIAKVSPQLLWNHWGFTTVKELRWMSCSGMEEWGFENQQVSLGISFAFLLVNRYHGEVSKTPKPLICFWKNLPHQV